MLFQIFSEGPSIPEQNILLLANAYALTQSDIDKLIEEVEPDYDGWVSYNGFVKLLTRLDPKLMEPDKLLSPKSEEREQQ